VYNRLTRVHDFCSHYLRLVARGGALRKELSKISVDVGQASSMVTPRRLCDTAEALLEMSRSSSSINRSFIETKAELELAYKTVFPLAQAIVSPSDYASIALQRARLRLVEKSHRLAMFRSAQASRDFLSPAPALHPHGVILSHQDIISIAVAYSHAPPPALHFWTPRNVSGVRPKLVQYL
jgi:hypothetical protein